MSGESQGSELSADALDQPRRRRWDIIERVVKTEFLPFVAAHLMEWQHVYPRYVTEARGEHRDLIDIILVVS